MSATTVAAPPLLSQAEFAFTQADLDFIVQLMMRETGISLSGAKAHMIYSRLAKRLRHLGLRRFADYCALVASEAGVAERGEMIAALTTNVTRFFREPHHFEHLAQAVLPGLITRARAGERIRLWSAACSTGQEPYSMALTLLNAMPDAAKFDIRILATDIDPNVLETGAQGIYDADLLEPVPAAMRKSWFSLRAGGQMQVNAPLRQLVAFRKLNLVGNWPMRGKFQVIFCRNVVIYFENDTQETIWARMLALMEPNAVLYIGHSERVSGPAEPELLSGGITIYLKHSGGGRA